MKFDSEIHHRRSIRLRKYDYAQAGAYSLTICTHNRECLFGNVVGGELVLTDAGRMVQSSWKKLEMRFSQIKLDQFIIMPNHFHGIITVRAPLVGALNEQPIIDRDMHKTGWTFMANPKTRENPKTRAPTRSAPTKTIGDIVGAFKSITTDEYIKGVHQHGWPPFPGKLWQRNYYEHIIRNENEWRQVEAYITNNPLKWETDRENPMADLLKKPKKQDEPWKI